MPTPSCAAGDYVRALCDRLGVEDFDDLWDKLIEAEEQLDAGRSICGGSTCSAGTSACGSRR